MSASSPDAPRVIELWPEGVPGLRADAGPEVLDNDLLSNVHHPSLTVYPASHDKANGTAVVICPGGGYALLAIEKEGTAIARWFNERGVAAFVLRSRLKEYGHPAPLRDALRALRTVRSRAPEFGVRPDRIGIVGFSAGGHLAASASTLYDDPDGRTGAEPDAVSARPDFSILVYPVISLQAAPTYRGSRPNLLGPAADDEALLKKLSANLQVTPETPPAFLVHTLEDKTVPVEQSILYYQALRAAGVPVEMHLYERGIHGFGLLRDSQAGREWPAACEGWLRERGLLTTTRPIHGFQQK